MIPADAVAFTDLEPRYSPLDFAELVRQHRAPMMAYALRLTGNLHTSEDVVQEAFTRAWQHRVTLENFKGPVRAWLLKVLRNIVIDQIRSQSRRPVNVLHMPTQYVIESVEISPREHRVLDCMDPADCVTDRLTAVWLLKQLSPAHRMVLERLYWAGRTVAEVASELGLAPGTVRSRTFYALREMRILLAEEIQRRETSGDSGPVGGRSERARSLERAPQRLTS
ncbi:sigma-70 family RNA polymerase sigma factor [Streptomyces chartreusis]|uniref:sigma-70 family RNA polymerase sigma factor n=1 Tax=Streptomyces chartreusis TaxID=1969 RepID=UPI00381A0E05